LSDSTRSTVTPRSANQATARQRTPVASNGGVVDLGVGDAGVVVDDRVHEGVAHRRAVPLALRLVWRRGTVGFAADTAPSAAKPPATKLNNLIRNYN
jgi:hypothetical protein